MVVVRFLGKDLSLWGKLFVTDKLIDEVSQLLVLVGLAARQIGDIITGRAQASHK